MRDQVDQVGLVDSRNRKEKPISNSRLIHDLGARVNVTAAIACHAD